MTNRLTQLPASTRVPASPLFRAQWIHEAEWRLWILEILLDIHNQNGESPPHGLIHDLLHAERVANWGRVVQ